MGSLTLWMQVSLDGYASGPDDAFDWPVVGPQLHQYFVDELRDSAAFLYGRRVYEEMAAFWPTAVDDANRLHREYARIWVPMRKYVLSSTLDDADWNSTVIGVGDVAAVKAATDGTIVMFGGATAAAEVIRAGLVDDYRLFVHPVLLGGGARLLPALDERAHLDLVGSRTFDEAVVHVHHRAR